MELIGLWGTSQELSSSFVLADIRFYFLKLIGPLSSTTAFIVSYVLVPSDSLFYR